MTPTTRNGAAWLALLLLSAALAGCGPAPAKDAAGTAATVDTSSGAPAGGHRKCALGQALDKCPIVTDAPATTVAATTTTETADAPVTHRLGDTAVIVAGDNSFGGTITAAAVTTRKRTNSMFGKRPKFGRYVEVTVAVRGTSGVFSINPLDFYLADAEGTRYRYAEGNSFTEDTANSLDATDLNAGEKVKGRLLFDASPQATTLGYEPSFTGDTVATWLLTK